MKREIVVSDFSGAEVKPGELVTITLRYEDGRKGEFVADAVPGDKIVHLIVSSGRRRSVRGRRSLDTTLTGQARAAAVA